MELGLGIIMLATFVEGFVQYLFGESEYSRPYLRYIALLLGVGAAIAYKVDIPAMFGLVTDWGMVNYVISGIVLGRGSNYLNDFIGRLRGADQA